MINYSYWLHFKQLVARQEGATMLEYGLMVGLIAVVAAGAVALFGLAVNQLFDIPPVG